MIQRLPLVLLDPAVPVAVATKNLDKFNELVTLWGQRAPRLMLPGFEYPDVDERFETYDENAVLKAEVLAHAVGGPALADDSGIEVEALDWGPGVRSARTPTPTSTPRERNEHILSELAKRPNASRRARMVCVCALVVPGRTPIIACGEVEGLIAPEPHGLSGFGYDPIFFYPAFGCTFGEAGMERKHVVSHRGNAVRALQQLLFV